MIFAIIFSTVVLISCTKTPLEQYNNYINDFKKGILKKPELLKKTFLEINSSSIISSNEITHNQNAIIERKADKLTMVFPNKFSIDNKEIKNLTFYDSSNTYAALSNGKTVHIYNKEGHLKDLTLAVNKKPLKALILYKDNLIYYKNFRVYAKNIISEKETLLIKRKFIPYYSRLRSSSH
jgi:hypothetical protein